MKGGEAFFPCAVPPAAAAARPALSTSAHAVNVAIKEHPAGARGEGGGTRTSGAEKEEEGLTKQRRRQCGVSAENLFIGRQASVPHNRSSSCPITRPTLGAGHICLDRAGALPSQSDGQRDERQARTSRRTPTGGFILVSDCRRM